ncbi:transglycosylase domain-containing protein [Streptomyces sp. ISL-14]|nr:transglycosylase domain-containing protein [Streptomyces sp. ISL-14]
MKAANGKVISEISTSEKRTYLKLEDIPLFLENLFIVTEDQKLYDHAGVDISGISRALLINSQIKQSNKAAVPLPSNWPGMFISHMIGRITENSVNSFMPIR